MKAKILFFAVASAICSFGADEVVALGYQTPGKKGGLSFLVKEGNGPWEHAFHKDFRMTGSNLGNWGEKEVQEPFVVRDGAGAYHLFHCYRARPAICHEESWNKHNLRNWGRENWIELPDLPKDARATGLVVESARDAFVMLFTDRKSGKAYKVRTDGKVALGPCEEIGRGEYDAARSRLLKVVEFDGATYTGGVVGITKEMREFLKSGQDEWHKSAPWHLTIDDAKDDEKKYSEAAKNAKLKLRIEPANKAYAISPMLVGAFFEDINSCADGGIVAELVQNGDFEYSRDDCWDWHPLTTWETNGGVEARTDDPVHANNAHYIRLQPGAEIANMGWGEWKDGKWQPAIFVEKGKKYDVSAYVRGKGKAIVKVNGRETALACAIHLCNLERNGDVVAMASYAPLFGKREHCRWSPDLIYFNNQRTELTTDYWTQWIFGNNAGDKCVPSKLEVASDNEAFRNRFAASVVKGGGKTIVKVVNSTPFPMPLEADLSPLGVRNGTKASVTLFAGRFDDQSAKPVTRTETLAAKLTRTLPPNSLTVLVFK